MNKNRVLMEFPLSFSYLTSVLSSSLVRAAKNKLENNILFHAQLNSCRNFYIKRIVIFTLQL